MNVHNIMEEKVINRVNELYKQVKEIKAPWLSCSCEHCQLDTISYVLNRIPPKYIVSGRGVTHSLCNDNTQLRIDIDTLIIEGMHAVSSARRPYHNLSDKQEIERTEGPVFNFPTFIGTLYDGTSFEPVVNASVTLKMNGEISEMVDYTWQNPNMTTALTRGAFSFWTKAIRANTLKESRVFHFTIEASATGYDKLEYNFDVPLISDCKVQESLNATYSLKIQDLYLFTEGMINPMED